MLKKKKIKASIPVICLKENEAYICYSPVFNLAAHGDSFKDAQRSFARTLKLFVEQVSEKGTWEEVLKERSRVTRLDPKAPSFWRMIERRRKEKTVSLEEMKRLMADKRH